VGFYEGWAGMYVGVLERKGVVVGGRGKEPRYVCHDRPPRLAWLSTARACDIATRSLVSWERRERPLRGSQMLLELEENDS